MKRFTETNKWRDPWFRRLSSPAKQLWGYITDNCDSIGLIEIDLKLASGDCGQKITQENIKELGDRVQDIGNNRYFIPTFISFQYGEISDKCPAHRPVIRQMLQRKLLKDGIAYRYPTATLLPQVIDIQQNQYPSARVALPYKNGMDKDRKEEGGTGGNGNGCLAEFDAFWKAYPKKISMFDAQHAFAEVNAKNFIKEILAAIEKQKRWESWTSDGGKYIPSPSNWLRDGRWNDKAPECGYQKSIL